MDSFNFTAVLLHPNTELLLIQFRQKLLQADCRSFIPLFPLCGIFTKEKFSKELKNIFDNTQNCRINTYFVKENILYFRGIIKTELSSIDFIIPSAVEKKTDSKDLLSVYSSALSIFQESEKLTEEKSFEEISFRSFQIADMHISKNQYSAFENFWIKSIT